MATNTALAGYLNFAQGHEASWKNYQPSLRDILPRAGKLPLISHQTQMLLHFAVQ